MHIYVAKDKTRKKKENERSQKKKIKRKKIPPEGLEPTAFVNIKCYISNVKMFYINVCLKPLQKQK